MNFNGRDVYINNDLFDPNFIDLDTGKSNLQLMQDGKAQEAIQNVNKTFYSEWLPMTRYQLADIPIIERYTQDNHQEVGIVIKEE